MKHLRFEFLNDEQKWNYFQSIFLKLGGTVLKGRKFQVKRHWEGRETNIYLSLSYGDIVRKKISSISCLKSKPESKIIGHSIGYES